MAYDISTANPRSWWRLGDRGAGTTCNDNGNSPSTLTYYTASSSASSLLTTDSNPAVQSSGGVASGPAGASLLGLASASVEAWVRLGTVSGRQYIWQMKDAKYDRYLYWTGTAFVFGVTNGTTTNEASATFDAKAGTVYYVVGTINGANPYVATLSVNGATLVSQPVSQGWWTDATTGTIYLGRDSAGTYPWSGVLDEVAVEGYVLGSTDIQSHYAQGAAITLRADSAWTVPATWRDGAASGTIRLDGQPWVAPASWRNGLAPGETASTGSPGGYALGAYGMSPYGGSSGGAAGPIVVTGSAWTSQAAWQDGHGGPISVDGEAWGVPAAWQDGVRLFTAWDPTSMLGSDGLHPNDDGMTYLAQQYRRALDKAGKTPAAGTKVYAYGDSWTAQDINNTVGKRAIVQFANSLGATLVNRAVGGYYAGDVAATAIGVSPILPSEVGLVALPNVGLNDLQAADTGDQRTATKNYLRALIAVASAAERIEQTAFTFDANWTSTNNPLNVASGGSNAIVQTNGATATYNITTPGTYYFLLFGWKAGDVHGGILTISQAGTTLATVDSSDQHVDTGHLVNSGYGNLAVRLDNVQAGTLTITNTSANGVESHPDALLRIPAAPRTILAVKPIRVLAASWNKPAMLDYIRGLYDTLAAEFGPHVVVADPDSHPIVLTGDAWGSTAAWQDGGLATFGPISGDPWGAVATWRDGGVSGTSVPGGAWSSRATWRDGTAGQFVTISGEAWASPAVWVDGQNVLATALIYDNDGYNYGGDGDVDFTPPVAPAPAGVVTIRRVHQSLPAPTLVDGRPT